MVIIIMSVFAIDLLSMVLAHRFIWSIYSLIHNNPMDLDLRIRSCLNMERFLEILVNLPKRSKGESASVY